MFFDIRAYLPLTGSMNNVTYREKPQQCSFSGFLVPLWCNKSLIEEADGWLKHHTKAALFVIFSVQQFMTYLITYHLDDWVVTLPSVLVPWQLSCLFFFFFCKWMKQVPVQQQWGEMYQRTRRLNFEFGMITMSNQHDTAHIHPNTCKDIACMYIKKVCSLCITFYLLVKFQFMLTVLIWQEFKRMTISFR